jgi:lipoprotein-releasing system ATP-binding protein
LASFVFSFVAFVVVGSTLVAFITVTSLNKRYRVGSQDIHVLRDLQLSVEPGEMVAVMGASGVGKSTLLHLLGGLDRPDGGTVVVEGRDLGTLSDEALVGFRNARVGFVFQFHHLLPEFSALENAEMPMRIARRAPSEARSAARLLLEAVGLGERLEHRPSMLSGGEQQRVAVARSLSNEPTVIMADEPTGNLDSTNGQHVIDLLFDVHARRGTTLVLVTHDAALAARADVQLSLRDGRVVPAAAVPAPVLAPAPALG